jgi:hypothetical protein
MRRMVGKQYGRQWPNLAAQALQGKYGRRITDITGGKLRLDGQNGHGLPKYALAHPRP